jgi:DNA topoisomerase I
VKVLIVESPNKIKTIKSFLGDGWSIKATCGHFMELSNDGHLNLGFDFLDDRVECRYSIAANKKQTVAQLKAIGKTAEVIYLATDEDREGESISWHLQKLFPANKCKRITFNEINQKAILSAVENAKQVDENLAMSAQARRCLDKYVGFTVSPLLAKANVGKSAGRVQTPALYLVYQREREIDTFTSKPYWSVWTDYEGFRAFYAGNIGIADEIEDEVDEVDDAAERSESSSIESLKILSAKEAERIVAVSQNNPHIVLTATTKAATKDPPPPLTTSTLQQVGSVKCGFSPEQTMKIAQELFEGVDLPNGRKSLITYHRTDSIALSEEFCQAVIEWLQSHDPENIPSKRKNFKNKAGVQGAHEAIRPSYVDLTPAEIANHLSVEQGQLYEIIWNRSIASQCSPAGLNKTKVVTQSGEVLWQSSGQTLVTTGYTKYWNNLQKDRQLPQLSVGQSLDPNNSGSDQKMTLPPARYTEAKLIKELERLGIGRPSTFASIGKTLRARGYTEVKKKVVVITPAGIKTAEYLGTHFPKLVAAGFTAEMEGKLDEIARGQTNWQQYLIQWNSEEFKPLLAKAGGNAPDKEVSESKLQPIVTKVDGKQALLVKKTVAIAKKGKDARIEAERVFDLEEEINPSLIESADDQLFAASEEILLVVDDSVKVENRLEVNEEVQIDVKRIWPTAKTPTQGVEANKSFMSLHLVVCEQPRVGHTLLTSTLFEYYQTRLGAETVELIDIQGEPLLQKRYAKSGYLLVEANQPFNLDRLIDSEKQVVVAHLARSSEEIVDKWWLESYFHQLDGLEVSMWQVSDRMQTGEIEKKLENITYRRILNALNREIVGDIPYLYMDLSDQEQNLFNQVSLVGGSTPGRSPLNRINRERLKKWLDDVFDYYDRVLPNVICTRQEKTENQAILKVRGYQGRFLVNKSVIPI